MSLFRRREIGDPEGGVYLVRWILAEAFGFRLMLHRFVRDDWARDLHDHPWWFVSLLIWGRYCEEGKDRVRFRFAGTGIARRATWRHRIMVVNPRTGRKGPAWTLVLTGRRQRDWGFWTRGRWAHHREYLRLW